VKSQVQCYKIVKLWSERQKER